MKQQIKDLKVSPEGPGHSFSDTLFILKIFLSTDAIAILLYKIWVLIISKRRGFKY